MHGCAWPTAKALPGGAALPAACFLRWRPARMQLLGRATLLLLGLGGARGQELVANGNFAFGTLPIDSAASVVGSYGRVSPGTGGMAEFPGTDASSLSALEIQPASGGARVVFVGSVAQRAVGWYRLRFFLHCSPDYDGSSSPLVLSIVDSAGTPLAGAVPQPVQLRTERNEWLHYDEWVPVNVAGVSGLTITAAPGATFGGGHLQITGLSVQWAAPSARALEAVNLASASLGCVGSRPGECPEGPMNGAPSIGFAHDGKTDTAWSVSKSVASTIALELALPGPSYPAVCAVQLWFDMQFTPCCFPSTWRLKVQNTVGGGWQTLATAASPGSVAPPGLSGLFVESGAGMRSFGIGCTTVTRIRLEMEDVQGLFLSLYELRLLTLPSSTPTHCGSADARASGAHACRNGGVCQDDGSCLCPSVASAGSCTRVACGWAGNTCGLPVCVGGVAGTRAPCDALPFSRRCAGPNTCGCMSGYHGAGGQLQCRTTQCGDRAVVASAGEECDDGNLVNGDGCDASCQNEPLPDSVQRVLSSSFSTKTVPWAAADGVPSPSALAATLGVDEARLCCITLDSSSDALSYGLKEFVLQCVAWQCQHGGSCILTGGEKGCDCSGTGYEGAMCDIPLCSVGCHHGGLCVGPDQCINCNAGWGGTFCGTVTDAGARTAAQAFAACVMVLLLLACCLVLQRFRWRPITARGGVALIVNMLGGTIWVEAASMQLASEEALGGAFDVNSPAGWELWATLVFGFGLWLGASLVYLRAMCQIHIFYVVPLSSLVFISLSLVPWMVAALLSSYTVALLLGVISFFYVFLLTVQLWPLAPDLPDIKAHGLCLGLGVVLVVSQLWLVQHGEAGGSGQASAGQALRSCWATSALVLVHFLTTASKLLYLALCRPRDVEVLKHYHDEWAPIAGSFHESMLSFDTQIKSERERVVTGEVRSSHSLLLGSFSRTRIGRKPTAALRNSGKWINKKVFRAGATKAKISAAAAVTQQGGKQEGSQPRRGSFRRGLDDVRGSFSKMASVVGKSRLGQVTNRGSFDRRQFGTRKRLGEQTLAKLGRTGTATAAAAAAAQNLTTAERGAGWRQGAAARVNKYAANRDEAAGAAGSAETTPQKQQWEANHPYAAKVLSSNTPARGVQFATTPASGGDAPNSSSGPSSGRAGTRQYSNTPTPPRPVAANGRQYVRKAGGGATGTPGP